MDAPDGTVVIDDAATLPSGIEIEAFAVVSSDAPDGVADTFQATYPDGTTRLRYDNSHDDPDLGPHHRHADQYDPTDTDEAIELTNGDIHDHYTRFLNELERG